MHILKGTDRVILLTIKLTNAVENITTPPPIDRGNTKTQYQKFAKLLTVEWYGILEFNVPLDTV